MRQDEETERGLGLEDPRLRVWGNLGLGLLGSERLGALGLFSGVLGFSAGFRGTRSLGSQRTTPHFPRPRVQCVFFCCDYPTLDPSTLAWEMCTFTYQRRLGLCQPHEMRTRKRDIAVLAQTAHASLPRDSQGSTVPSAYTRLEHRTGLSGTVLAFDCVASGCRQPGVTASLQARFGLHVWVDEVLGPGPEAYSVLQVPILYLVTIALCTERVAESETDALLLGFGESMNLYAPPRPLHYPGQVFLRCVGLTTTGGSKGFGLSVIHARRSYTSFECLADGRDVTSPRTLSRLQSLQKAETRLCGAQRESTHRN